MTPAAQALQHWLLTDGRLVRSIEELLDQFTAQLRKSKYERNSAKHSPLENISKKMRRSKISQHLIFKRFHDEIWYQKLKIRSDNFFFDLSSFTGVL